MKGDCVVNESMHGTCTYATGANPTIASYSASVVNFYNATDSLARFEKK
jgi:hypothetical protein